MVAAAPGRYCGRCGGRIDHAPAPLERAAGKATVSGAPRETSLSGQGLAWLLVSLVGAIATFLPWGGIGSLMFVDGTRGDGWLSLACFAGSAAIAVRGGRRGQPMRAGAVAGVLLLALFAVAVGVVDLSGLRASRMVSAGSGLYLVLVAGGVLAFLAAHELRWWLAAVLVLLAGATGVLGSIHITRDASGQRVCPKSQWTLQDTFVDASDYVGKRISTEDVATADLLACDLLEVAPPPQPEPAAPRYGSCEVDGARGVCEPARACGGRLVAGLCPGADDIRCCLP